MLVDFFEESLSGWWKVSGSYNMALKVVCIINSYSAHIVFDR